MKVNSGFIAILIMFVLMASIGFYQSKFVVSDITIVVNEKERVTDKDGNGSKYLIFTDGEVFQNSDNIWWLKFNSSDLYGIIKPGKKYNVTVCGWRIPFFSSYRNIVKINSEVKE